MKQRLEICKGELTTIGPVFIGSGREINKKEYIFSQPEHKVYIPDEKKWWGFLRRRGLLKQYESYMLDSGNQELALWCRKNNITSNDYKACMKYSLECGDYIPKKGKKLQVMEFVKDGYGEPYIPGSSVKGMLRTVLLAADIRKNPEKYRAVRQQIERECKKKCSRKNYLSREIDMAEAICFRSLRRLKDEPSNAVNDIMFGMVIGDSRPIAFRDMVLCQKIDTNKAGNGTSLPLLRESIRPGTKIEFDITIDTEVCRYNKDDIREAINLFQDTVWTVFLRKFKIPDIHDRKNIVWLGGGSGFLSKTVLYQLMGEEKGIDTAVEVFNHTLPEKINRQHGHDKDRGLGVSPHVVKMTTYQSRPYQMGMASFCIK